ncbi:MAG: glycosyltransferase [Candidatus Omnitrophota bacterium]|nr:glycosyltransferase [Candidatus Omnitrophota bacterium]
MIKLLLVISSYEIGGVSSIAKNLLDSLDRNKFKIIFLAEKIQENYYPIPNDVCVIDLNIGPKNTILGKVFNMARHIRNFRKTIISREPNIVFSLSYNTSCYLLFKPIKKLKEKVIIGEYSENFFVKPIKHNLRHVFFRIIYKTLIFFTYRQATQIVVVSQSIRGHMEKLFNIDRNKIKVISTPINIADVKRRSQEPISDYVFQRNFLYISLLSRLSPEKGINYLLQAFAKLRQRVQSKLIIIGEGDSRYNLEAMAKTLNIDKDVDFMGYKDNPFKYLKNTDMFVLPSLSEGFPNVILESYVCKVPVIATRCVGGIEEIISDGKNGILVNPGDANSLYKAMYNLALNRELREQVKAEGVKKVNEFDISVKIKEYENLFLDTFMQNKN